MVTPMRTPDAEDAARFVELGVHRPILHPRSDLDEAGLVDYVTRVGTLIGRGLA